MSGVQLGRWGVWGHSSVLTATRARRIEQLGFTALWEGGSPAADLTHA
jgi:hypothetical protein